MAWAHQDCDRTLTLGEQRKDYDSRMKEKLREAEEQRQKAEELAETRAAELEVGHAELKATHDELDRPRESSFKYRDDSVMEISRLTAQAEDVDRRLVKSPRRSLQPRLRPWPSTSLRLSWSSSGVTLLIKVSAHSFLTYGVSIRNGTCPSWVRRLLRRWPSSMHLRRPL